MKLYIDGKSTILDTDDIAVMTPMRNTETIGVLILLKRGNPKDENIFIRTDSEADSEAIVNSVASALGEGIVKISGSK